MSENHYSRNTDPKPEKEPELNSRRIFHGIKNRSTLSNPLYSPTKRVDRSRTTSGILTFPKSVKIVKKRRKDVNVLSPRPPKISRKRSFPKMSELLVHHHQAHKDAGKEGSTSEQRFHSRDLFISNLKGKRMYFVDKNRESCDIVKESPASGKKMVCVPLSTSPKQGQRGKRILLDKNNKESQFVTRRFSRKLILAPSPLSNDPSERETATVNIITATPPLMEKLTRGKKRSDDPQNQIHSECKVNRRLFDSTKKKKKFRKQQQQQQFLKEVTRPSSMMMMRRRTRSSGRRNENSYEHIQKSYRNRVPSIIPMDKVINTKDQQIGKGGVKSSRNTRSSVDYNILSWV